MGDEIEFVDDRGRVVMRESADGKIKVNETFGKLEKPEDQKGEGIQVTLTPEQKKDGKRTLKIEVTEEDGEE